MSDAQGILIDDGNDEYVSYFPPGAWRDMRGTNYRNLTFHGTYTPGASCTFTFTGVSVAYYSDKNFDHGNFTVSIDGNHVFTGSSYDAEYSTQKALFSQNVEPGQHVLTVSNALNLSGTGVDYFIYVPISTSLTSTREEGTTRTSSNSGQADGTPASNGNAASFRPSVAPSASSQTGLSPAPHGSAARMANVPLIAGIVGGVTALVAAIFAVFFFLRRRKSKLDPEIRVVSQEEMVQSFIARRQASPPPYPEQQSESVSDTRSRKMRQLHGYPVQAN